MATSSYEEADGDAACIARVWRKVSRGRLLGLLAAHPKCTEPMEVCAGAPLLGPADRGARPRCSSLAAMAGVVGSPYRVVGVWFGSPISRALRTCRGHRWSTV